MGRAGMVASAATRRSCWNYNLTSAQEVLAKQHRATPVTPKMLVRGRQAAVDLANTADIPYSVLYARTRRCRAGRSTCPRRRPCRLRADGADQHGHAYSIGWHRCPPWAPGRTKPWQGHRRHASSRKATPRRSIIRRRAGLRVIQSVGGGHPGAAEGRHALTRNRWRDDTSFTN